MRGLLNGEIPEMGEPLVRDFKDMQLLVRLPTFLLPLAKKFFKMMGETRMIDFIRAFELSNEMSTMHLTTIRNSFVEEIVNRFTK